MKKESRNLAIKCVFFFVIGLILFHYLGLEKMIVEDKELKEHVVKHSGLSEYLSRWDEEVHLDEYIFRFYEKPRIVDYRFIFVDPSRKSDDMIIKVGFDMSSVTSEGVEYVIIMHGSDLRCYIPHEMNGTFLQLNNGDKCRCDEELRRLGFRMILPKILKGKGPLEMINIVMALMKEEFEYYNNRAH